ncbi:spermidine/putrescine transport system substrate-binding protein [Bacilli bacterium PM5-3]|nr:spermidine/putrescine transport system substrate-binding protein [Bacilli bacterium PM5-3]
MKKITNLFLISLFLFILSSCGVNTANESLYILNWGDYINYDLITKFEEENDVEVIITEVESNEAMYEQIKMNRTSFDIAIPSDYMIDQLAQENLIKEIEFDKLKKYNKNNFSKLALKHGPKSGDYIPYFNGTLGIMYNTKNIKNIETTIKKYGWEVLFDKNILPDAKIGMYNSSRDAFAASLMKNKISINTKDKNDLDVAYKSLKEMSYTSYGDDNLKKNVVTGNLDLALVYSGDYYEELIVATDEENDINFSYYAPSTNNYWLDGMVIPKDSKNYELAHKFIDFMLEKENAISNAEYIGYASPLTNVMDYLRSDSEYDYLTSNPYYDPSMIKGLNAESFKFLGVDYMISLEELFTKSKTK